MVKVWAPKADNVGRRIECVCAVSNGWAQAPRGTVFTIERVSPGKLHLLADPCDGCGLRLRMTLRAKVGGCLTEFRDAPKLITRR